MDPLEGFKCDVCSAFLRETDTSTGSGGAGGGGNKDNEVYTRFGDETKRIVDLLRLTEDIIIPE